MEGNGIAWMIAGGVRAESLEDRRQRQQRADLAHIEPGRGDAMLRLRRRIAAIVGGHAEGRTGPGSLSADCCPA